MAKPQRPVHVINAGRFDRRVVKTPDGCWTWLSSTAKRTRTDGSTYRMPLFAWMDPGTRKTISRSARRWAWEQQYGELPKDSIMGYGENVVNVCGNQLCVRPSPDHNKPMSQLEHHPNKIIALQPALKPGKKTEEEVLG